MQPGQCCPLSSIATSPHPPVDTGACNMLTGAYSTRTLEFYLDSRAKTNCTVTGGPMPVHVLVPSVPPPPPTPHPLSTWVHATCLLEPDPLGGLYSTSSREIRPTVRSQEHPCSAALHITLPMPPHAFTRAESTRPRIRPRPPRASPLACVCG
jgi:hypothetical protein